MKRRFATGSLVLALGLFAMPASADEPAPSGSPPASSAAAPAAPTTEPPKAETHRTAWPWIVLGTGLALVATSAVFAGLTLHEDSQADKTDVKISALTPSDPGRSALVKEKEDHESKASSSRTTAIIFGTVGFLTIAGSILMWYFEGSSSSEAPAKTAKMKPTFAPAIGPGYAGGSLGLSF